MPITDWQTIARARGLELSDVELTKMASVLDALEPAYLALISKLTHDIEPAITLGEEAVETR